MKICYSCPSLLSPFPLGSGYRVAHARYLFLSSRIVRFVHDTFACTRANTQLSGAAISSTVFEIYAALAASAGAGVRNDTL